MHGQHLHLGSLAVGCKVLHSLPISNSDPIDVFSSLQNPIFMLRLSKIVEHLAAADGKIREEKAIQEVKLDLMVSKEQLKLVQLEFLSEMVAGLESDGGSTIRMLPSYVHQRPTSDITGDYYALDLGGTNFRVLELKIVNGRVVSNESQKFVIPEKHMKGIT